MNGSFSTIALAVLRAAKLISWRKKELKHGISSPMETKVPKLQISCLPGAGGSNVSPKNIQTTKKTAESKHQKPHRTPNRSHHSAEYDSQKALPERPPSEPPSYKWLPPALRGVETDRTPPPQSTGQFNEIFSMGMNQNLCLLQYLPGCTSICHINRYQI